MTQTMKRWVRGLVGAAINSAATAVTIVIVDPVNFNPMGDGLGKVLTVMGVSALFGAALFLKQHPLPEDEVLGV